MLQEATIARKARRTDEVITGERQSAIAPMEENPQGPPSGEELTMLKSAPPQAQVQGCASVSFPIYPQPNPVINAKLPSNPHPSRPRLNFAQILQCGPHACVLRPLALRDRLRAVTAELAQRYREETTTMTCQPEAAR